MQINKIVLGLFCVALFLASCIERYYPDSETNFTSKLVIEGSITTDEGMQQIVVSRSSSAAEPEFIPVSNCDVYVEDSNGHQFVFHEGTAGYYNGTVPDYYMVIGNSYRLHVKTPDGDEYVSKYEELLPCPDVDSVYAELTSVPTTDPNVDEDGLQFYIDFEADSNYGSYYRFGLVETYEYHADYPLDKWLDDDGYHDLANPDYSNMVCYKTDTISSIFALSTQGFTENRYSHYKLHFVNDHSQRLLYKYSLLVTQYSMTKSAYEFWDNIRKNNQESVDLFGRQPANVQGNIYNAQDTTEYALGYFGVSAVRTKRIMVDAVSSLSFSSVFHCKPVVPDGPLPPDGRPFYYAQDLDDTGLPFTGLVGAECIFCQLDGGTTEKPSYWDE